LGFPSRRTEGWRYFDLHPLEQAPLSPTASGSNARVPGEIRFGGAKARLFLLDGSCMSAPAYGAPDGVWFGSTRRAIAMRSDLLKHTGMVDPFAEYPIAALNAAFFADGFVLDVPSSAVVDDPVDIIHFASESGSLHTRSLVNLGEGSRVTIIETYAGKGRYWRNDVVVARLGAGARLTRIVVVEEGQQAIHTALFDAALEENARLDTFCLLLGGSRVRQEWNVRLQGEGAGCRLDGAFVVAGTDEANIVTAVDHAAPGGQTRELVKGVAADRGHGAFQGRIIVREHAQKTDAHQLSRNLLLGRRAVIDTKPELEILADDVKCAHGASVGDLDEAALFYLRARGIPADEARRMLIEGFLREAADGVADAALRDHLLRRLGERLGRLEERA